MKKALLCVLCGKIWVITKKLPVDKRLKWDKIGLSLVIGKKAHAPKNEQKGKPHLPGV
jgi:hypothetical protein